MLGFKIDHDTGGAGRCQTPDAHVIACPNCQARLAFMRSSFPPIDSCGFESYRLACEQCGTRLAGIVDPADDALLLSAAQD